MEVVIRYLLRYIDCITKILIICSSVVFIFYFDQEYLLFSLAQTLSMWCHIPLEMLEPPM